MYERIQVHCRHVMVAIPLLGCMRWMHHNLRSYNILLAHDLISPSAYTMITNIVHSFHIWKFAYIKTLVAKQWPILSCRCLHKSYKLTMITCTPIGSYYTHIIQHNSIPVHTCHLSHTCIYPPQHLTCTHINPHPNSHACAHTHSHACAHTHKHVHVQNTHMHLHVQSNPLTTASPSACFSWLSCSLMLTLVNSFFSLATSCSEWCILASASLSLLLSQSSCVLFRSSSLSTDLWVALYT